jgi:hypothetical protein
MPLRMKVDAKQRQKEWLRIGHFQNFLIKIIGKNKNGKK